MSEHDPVFEGPVGNQTPADLSIEADEQPVESLTDDVRALIDDGKTYLETELQFQKSRAAFVADRGRSGATYALGALVMVHLALIALAVGAVLALATLIGPLGATAVVVGILLVAGVVLGLAAKRRFGNLSTAFGETRT